MRIGLTRAVSAAAIILALTGSGCDEPSGPDRGSEYVEAVRRWQAAEPPRYSYTIQVSCFCGFEEPGPVRVVVRQGVTESATYVQSGNPVSSAFYDRYLTVEKLFGVIQSALRGADRVRAQYDPANGVPRSVSVDWLVNAADDEVAFEVTTFARVP